MTEYNRVQYILRPGLPLLEDDALWREVLTFAKSTKVDAIMAFNAHGEMPPHPELHEIRERIGLLSERFAEIRRHGMVPMVNYFVTLGHGEAKPAANMGSFQPIVDGFGNRVMGCACPLDPAFQTYICEAFRLHAELDADSIWIDDDFRLFSREGAETLQCFCDLHLKLFARKAGRRYSRDELIGLLLEHEWSNREIRRLWFAVQGESLLQLVHKLREAVVAVNPEMGMGMMITSIANHYFSGRDLNAEMQALQTTALQRPWLRTGGGYWNDERPLDLLSKLIQVVDPFPAILQAPARLCCEIENYPFVPGIKSARSLALEMYINTISTNGLLTLSINDFFLGIHDPSGNVTKMLPAMKPYLEQVAQAAEGKKRRGASLPFPPNLVEVGELAAEQFSPHWNINLARLGIPQAPTDAAPTILVGKTVSLFADEQLDRVLRQGAILDPEAYILLREKGFLADCPIHVVREKLKNKVQTEKVTADHAPAWLKGKNLAARWHVSYNTAFTVHAQEGAEVWSILYDTEGSALSAGVVVTSGTYRIAVVPHTGQPMKEAGRQWLYQQIMSFVTNRRFPVMVEDILEIYPVWWEGDHEALLGLCCFGSEQFPLLRLWLPGRDAIQSVEQLDRSGSWKKVAHAEYSSHSDGGIRLVLTGGSVPEPYSFETFRLTFDRAEAVNQ
ncbi:hypothetical protein ACFPPD_20075 [Cohnella suwonensis]|uniref:Glycoside hydrolase family 42 N-terminal domain-containing protein n=1 Tax=Cohnella suwonensis TaxID=696072 RepID=A0ABW0LYU3_9BACL